MRFCQVLCDFRGGGSTRQPQHTEPCQCVSGQSWACHGPLKAQMLPLHCAVGVVEPVLGATAGLGRYLLGLVVLLNDGVSRRGNAVEQLQRTKPYQCVSSQYWACNEPSIGKMYPLQCASGVVEPGPGVAVGRGRWFWGRVVLLKNAGVIQLWRRCSATTAHRALLVCEWPALAISWAIASLDAASAVYSRCGGACTDCWDRAGQVVCGGCCGFWRNAGGFQLWRRCSATTAYRALPVCEWPGQSWVCHGPCKAKCSI